MMDGSGKKRIIISDGILCYCGEYGQLKADLRRPSTRYAIDHYQSKARGVGWTHHNGYRKSCYIGSVLKLGDLL